MNKIRLINIVLLTIVLILVFFSGTSKDSVLSFLGAAIFYFVISHLLVGGNLEKKGYYILLVLLYLSIWIFPLIHFMFYKYDLNLYYKSDYFTDSVEYRLEQEKHDKMFSEVKHKIVDKALRLEDSLVLGANDYFYFKKLNYLDSITTNRFDGTVIKSKSDYLSLKPGPMSGGGIHTQGLYLVLYKNNLKIRLKYDIGDSKTLESHLKKYSQNYKNFINRYNDVYEEIGFIDFWLASVSLFKFSELIPNSNLTKLIWLIQSAVSFILLFFISNSLPKISLQTKKG
ncbi:hypothetical protein [Aestuariibaculum sediminum]|uniref:Uncharacterized protein n=1 Tax=Aestuariibaculum sediminum TaxID=2770637 RepID=A0A8J6UHQ3_9FLAO|nr:hypothetical protein [Aestuariibaculum sediminum]MBD0833206.1 hypothetical protein [Aestuariibaculum sediminum]